MLNIYSTKKIKAVTGLLEVDKTTGWLWILSFVGIVALPPSMLFISEFMIIKTMLAEHKIALCIIFLLLLTIILYGLAKAVIRMSFLPVAQEKELEVKNAVKSLNWTMYLPQIVMLVLVFVWGLAMPKTLVAFITNTIIGF